MNTYTDAKKWTASELEDFPQFTMWLPPRSNAAYRVHPTVALDGIEIDEGLAALMTLLWERGIQTGACCQGHPLDYHLSGGSQGHAYILFRHFNQAVNFLREAFTAECFQATEGTHCHQIELRPLDSPHGEASVQFPPLLIDEIYQAVKGDR